MFTIIKLIITLYLRHKVSLNLKLTMDHTYTIPTWVIVVPTAVTGSIKTRHCLMSSASEIGSFKHENSVLNLKWTTEEMKILSLKWKILTRRS